MKMLLRCNPDAADVLNSCGHTPMQCLKLWKWDFFAGEKEQVMNDLKQHPSYWNSIEQQALLQSALEETDRRRSMRRSMARRLTGERHPEALFDLLLRKDWKTALIVILHSPHWAKIPHPMLGLPLNVAIEGGAPVEVVAALLEAYPDATTIRNQSNDLPCHSACCYGISSEVMKMLLRCNPDAVDATNNVGRTPMHCLKLWKWDFFAGEKEQVMNDLKQHPSFWKYKERSLARRLATYWG
jgi:hypothetical protein